MFAICINNIQMSESPLTNECPYCSQSLQVSECACESCGIAIRGSFPDAPLGNLPTEHQRFIEMFVLASGNLKEIASHAGVSYPTVRSRLDKVIAALGAEIGTHQDTKQARGKRAGKKAPKSTRDSPTAAEIIKRI